MPVDAIPDLSDTQVIVYTDWPGQAPQVVEDQVTYPLLTTFLAVPKVKVVRGQSMFSSSFVYVIFQDRTDLYWARSRVLEYLNAIQSRLPRVPRPDWGPTPPAWAGSTSTRSRVPGIRPTGSARSRTSKYATRSSPFRAWPRSRVWADTCANTRCCSTRPGSWPTA